MSDEKELILEKNVHRFFLRWEFDNYPFLVHNEARKGPVAVWSRDGWIVSRVDGRHIFWEYWFPKKEKDGEG